MEENFVHNSKQQAWLARSGLGFDVQTLSICHWSMYILLVLLYLMLSVGWQLAKPHL